MDKSEKCDVDLDFSDEPAGVKLNKSDCANADGKVRVNNLSFVSEMGTVGLDFGLLQGNRTQPVSGNATAGPETAGKVKKRRNHVNFCKRTEFSQQMRLVGARMEMMSAMWMAMDAGKDWLASGGELKAATNEAGCSKQFNLDMKAMMAQSRSMRPSFSTQNFKALREECRLTGVLFEDPEFLTNDTALFYSARKISHCEWSRPAEICADPKFFVDGYARFAANLTRDERFFCRMVPADNRSFGSSYLGIFHFCFWQFGDWVDVVIDDRLPTYRGELVYMQSTKRNEFWSALLEKALAKLHGSYEAIKGLTSAERMENFTGGVRESYKLMEPPSNLFNILEQGWECGSMMGCSIAPDLNVSEAETPQGLICGRSYSITKVQSVEIVTLNVTVKIPLLRLRNPFGKVVEWNGPWSCG